LTGAGIPCIGIPGTIDNDIAASEYTIGFDTALNTAVEMVDRLRDTMESHDRCSVVQVMGRRCGDIALETGIAVGATSILVPEIPYDFQHDIVDRMTLTQKTGKMHFIIVVAEGVGGVELLAEKIEKATGIETRATVLGHVQRGGSPTLRDRVVGSQMGALAAKLLYEGSSNRVIVMRGGKIVDLDITGTEHEARFRQRPLCNCAPYFNLKALTVFWHGRKIILPCFFITTLVAIQSPRTRMNYSKQEIIITHNYCKI
jgi:6-phosphofructokinase 1